MALYRPGVPSNGTPRLRARGRCPLPGGAAGALPATGANASADQGPSIAPPAANPVA
jgi:hypothetical protein